MEVRCGKRFDKKLTFQAEFGEKLECECSGTMLPMVQVCDDGGGIADNRPDGAKLWPHDSMAIVVYMCENCMGMRVKWNQA